MPSRDPWRIPARVDSGFSLVEVFIAVMVLVIAAVGTLQLSIATVGLEAQNREKVLATDVLRGVVEEMRATPFNELFSRYNAVLDDNPLEGVSRGATFRMNEEVADVGNLECDVSIVFPVDEEGALSETVTPIADGLISDLNASGETESTTSSEAIDYRVLPAVITIAWDSADGNRREFSVPMMFSRTSGEDS